MKKHGSTFLAMSLILVILFGCSKNDVEDKATTTNGIGVTMGGGGIHSFLTTDADGQPVEMGLEFEANALTGLATDTSGGHTHFPYSIPLPVNASGTGIDHIEVDWNPYGHEPAGVYSVPHFDFHFYYVDESVPASVIPGPDTVAVPSQFIPQDYVSSIVAVPGIGVNYFDPTSPEFHGVPFSSTFIYGFYHGSFMFIGPMVTKAFLETHPDYSAPVKQPQAFQITGYYPTEYKVRYNADRQVYQIYLSGLTQH